jgi:hypothetical protein
MKKKSGVLCGLFSMLLFHSYFSYAGELFEITPDSPEEQLEIIQSLKNDIANSKVQVAELIKPKLNKNTKKISLNITDGISVSFNRISADVDKGHLTWRGELTDLPKRSKAVNELEFDPFNYAILMSKGNNLTGSFRVDGQLYQIWPIDEKNKIILVKVDESKVIEEQDNPKIDDMVSKRNVVCSDDNNILSFTNNTSPSEIRVVLVTTEQSRAKLVGTDVSAMVAQAFTEANQGVEDSDVGIIFQSAGILDVDYTEHGSFSDMLSEMRTATGGSLSQQIDQYRTQHRADLAVLVAATTSSTGTAYNDASRSSAFSVVRYSRLTGTYTFAHEMGHNIGASHDLDQYDGTPKRLPCYRHGFKHESSNPDERWRTIMSYDCETGKCGRLNLFSNPRLTYRDIPVGSVKFEDNARRLNERRETVANFYP